MAPRLRRDDYTVGWICALHIELAAAQEMLDEEHEDLEQDEHETNIYSLGRIGEHNVVIVCLPAGLIGNNPAAAVGMQLRATFRSVRFGLMVGIGGGMPVIGGEASGAEVDIRLGDVVVSQPHLGHGGVIQYDFGKATPSGFERTGFLNSPPTILLGAVSKLRSNQVRRRTKIMEHMAKLWRLPEFTREAAGPDVLFKAECSDEHGQDGQVEREPRPNEEPVIHYGTIASGNQVIKHAAERDMVSKEFGGVLCFEMEAAGLMNSFPCLVIRGICDYADSHKNKKWQPYAAGAAAACAKEVLLVLPRAEMAKVRTADETIRIEETQETQESRLDVVEGESKPERGPRFQNFGPVNGRNVLQGQTMYGSSNTLNFG
ncbi:purine and uridine phosphorylase [Periconia macrospinosa]|uniref:Purine and uridine phosphorylase n=1 Tax=Periconia macrospinosa TaxID=97972 RepID=A0A2V1DTR2_9PLEO|nr:purine and uridine phosphorylase [Periconia macrospinosa]